MSYRILKVDQLNRKHLHQQKLDEYCIPLLVTYSQAFPALKDILSKHWHIKGKSKLKKTFSTLPIIAFRKDTSLKQITGTNTIHNNEKPIKNKNSYHTAKCAPCNSTWCLCFQQLISTTTFKSNQTNKTKFTIK